jgi:hypothetical protein
MATRSRIGIQLSNESVLSAYHHWDGYPEWLGRILNTHYNTRDKVAELIDGGDMSSCWTEDRWNGTTTRSYVYQGKGYTDTIPVEDTAKEYGPQYYSQRGVDCPPRFDENIYEYLADGEEYAYLYTLKGEWVCYNRNEFGTKYPEVVEIPNGALAV